MILTIASVLDADSLSHVRRAMDTLVWRDGSRTAGSRARPGKRNEQAAIDAELQQFLVDALQSNSVLRAAARPRRFSRFILSRTGVGGRYAEHIDNAIMGEGADALRSDLSITVMLNEPDEYDGGALAVDTPSGVFRARPPAGDAVVYPTGSIHAVEPVTRGKRLACVGWIQSRIRRADQRELLFDLETVRASLPPRAEGALTLDKTISNLIRMWSDA